jgi:metal-sulfur cluster biosynthetic enzyme
MAANVSPIEEKLMEALHDVQDAELPADVVDMGLIYGIRYRESDRHVDVKMTFTAMGCPAMEIMMMDVRDRLLREPMVDSVAIEVVWDPPWDRRRLRPRAVAALGGWGIIS